MVSLTRPGDPPADLFRHKVIMDYLEEISPEQFNAILDSKLIVTTIPKELLYDIKLVDCGDYAQVYIYESKKYRGTKQDQDVDLQLKKLKLDNIVNKNVSNDNNDIKLFEINVLALSSKHS